MQQGLAEMLVDSDLTPTEIVEALRGAPPPQMVEPVAEEEPEIEYPHNYAPSRWQLSDGTKMRGTKEKALEAERAISDNPEY